MHPSLSKVTTSLGFYRACFIIKAWFLPAGSAMSSVVPEARYYTMGRASASTVGSKLLQSRVLSSSNPDIPAPQAAADQEVQNIMTPKVAQFYCCI